MCGSAAGRLPVSKQSCTTLLLLQALAREVAYELIAFSQRRRLHAALAEAQEAALQRGGGLQPAAANIAYNYSCACATVEVSEWRHTLKASVKTERHPEEAINHVENQALCGRCSVKLMSTQIGKLAALGPDYRQCWGWEQALQL